MAILMIFCNSKRRESKNPCGKYLQVFAKNQLRFENFEFAYENLNGKLTFYPFLSIFQDLCHFIRTPLESNIIFLQHFSRFRGGYSRPPLAGATARLLTGVIFII